MLIAALATTVCLVLPVHTHVVDTFRAPPCDRCAGNRGLDLATTPGQAVGAGTDGLVTFAGQVGGHNYVVVRTRADARLRLTYGGLATIAVRRGDAVALGDMLGYATDSLFFGVRRGERHVDPQPYVGRPSGAWPESRARPRFRITLGAPPLGNCAG